ncbi:mitochondrial uncoupling protein 2-like [Centruroides sculpturatus]|uniref:mitochondrial uncoupling protein 2-like n=1 Tax=Centruroides sculpturatus TaxID=218467 RepID=UPI000C6EE43B|nr:mitochondrial uncoupling protein 2-like [Centruroides sculpturatus]
MVVVPGRSEPGLPVKVLGAGAAACVADAITFPLDVAKVRLQIQGEMLSQGRLGRKGVLKYRGVAGTLLTMARQEGWASVYNGLCAGLQRQMCFASIRIGMYDTVKTYYSDLTGKFTGNDKKRNGVGIRILAGISTGGISVVCAQPTDVVKVRMQAQNGNEPKRYTGTIHAYKTIGRQEGLAGLWKGTVPNITRNAIINAAELVCYDCVKEFLIVRRYMSDNLPCHFASAFAAGFCATVVASPVDVVKTRYMNSPLGSYRGVVDCAARMLAEGGPTAFYKGFVPSFVRLASWNVCMFVTYEQLKRLFSAFQRKNVLVLATS